MAENGQKNLLCFFPQPWCNKLPFSAIHPVSLLLTGAVSDKKIPKFFVSQVEASRQDRWI
jgi:hypothetical protein